MTWILEFHRFRGFYSVYNNIGCSYVFGFCTFVKVENKSLYDFQMSEYHAEKRHG